MLWIVALVALAWDVRQHDSVRIALLVTGASIVVWLCFLVPMRERRRREEEQGR